MERDGGVSLRTDGGGRVPICVAYIHMAASFSLFTCWFRELFYIYGFG